MSKVVIKNRDVRIETASIPAHGSKQVELLQEDGIVHAIQVRCTCGEITVLELEYPSPSGEKS